MHTSRKNLANPIQAPAPAPLASQSAPQASQSTATSENVKPNNSSTAAPSTVAAASSSSKTEVPPAAKVSSESSRAVDEKMPVMSEEPPEIKTKAAAPGMSATSGPLDDFPLEGDKP